MGQGNEVCELGVVGRAECHLFPHCISLLRRSLCQLPCYTLLLLNNVCLTSGWGRGWRLVSVKGHCFVSSFHFLYTFSSLTDFQPFINLLRGLAVCVCVCVFYLPLQKRKSPFSAFPDHLTDIVSIIIKLENFMNNRIDLCVIYVEGYLFFLL